MVAARLGWIASQAEPFSEQVARIGGGTIARLDYASSIEIPENEASPEVVEQAILEALMRTRERERRRGMTVVGPHRDNLRIRVRTDGSQNWIDLRAYGSGGQQRTAAIALRMLEAGSRRERNGREPVILLDDVFAELDPGRTRRILDWIEEHEVGQVILTAPKSTDIQVRGAVLPSWGIVDGAIGPL